MPRISDERREQQRRRIVDAGVAVVLRRGLAGLSMAEVIEESGLSAGAIYGYFAGKDELLLAVARDVLTSRAEHLEVLAAERPVPAPAEALRRFLESVPEDLIRSGLVLQLWGDAARRPEVSEHAAAMLDELQTAMAGYVEAWLAGRPDVTAEQAEARARSAAPALLGLVQGYVAQSALRGPLDTTRYLDGVAAAAGLLARG